MATKTLYATGTFKYQHRMLKAGDPVEMDGPTSRLYEHLGKVTDKKPRVAKAEPAPQPAEANPVPVAAEPRNPARRRKARAKK